jgi:hypothetical protein
MYPSSKRGRTNENPQLPEHSTRGFCLLPTLLLYNSFNATSRIGTSSACSGGRSIRASPIGRENAASRPPIGQCPRRRRQSCLLDGTGGERRTLFSLLLLSRVVGSRKGSGNGSVVCGRWSRRVGPSSCRGPDSGQRLSPV